MACDKKLTLMIEAIAEDSNSPKKAQVVGLFYVIEFPLPIIELPFETLSVIYYHGGL